MDAGTSASMTETSSQQREPAIRPNTLREKTKRPQLSCNPCRSRKVKVGLPKVGHGYPIVLTKVFSSAIVSNHVPPAHYIKLPECVNMIFQRQSGNQFCKLRL